MSPVHNLKKKAGEFFLATELRKDNRQRKVVGFQEARKIGIVYPVTAGDDKEQDILKKYALYLKEERKQFHFLGYVDRMKIPEHLKDTMDHSFFSRSDLNWYLRPVRGNAQRFLDQEFDVLIDLSIRDSVPLLYICGLSGARFKIGRMRPSGNNIFDMMISLDGEVTMKELFKQIDHYLNVIHS
ncbi:MAG: hypothetical protein KDD36_09855 [Flavobacteriales bacterium]|nr:hypothetical protein [Flavobacteriales bacterium]